MTKHKLLFLLAISSICLLVLSPGAYAENKIIAVVNQDVITQKDLDDFSNFMRLQMSGEYSDKELDKKIGEIKPDLLKRLIEDKLILQEAKNLNISVDKNRIKERMQQIKKNYPSETEFHSALGSRGLTEADLEKRLQEQLLTYAVIDKAIKSKIIILPQEVSDFYQKNKENFILPEAREYESIAISDTATLQDFINGYEKGDSLEDLAKTYGLTIDKDTAYKNTKLLKEVEEELFTLKPGMLSRPLKISNTYYLFRVNSIIAKRQQILPEVQQIISDFIFDIKMRQELDNWLDKLKKKAYVRVL